MNEKARNALAAFPHFTFKGKVTEQEVVSVLPAPFGEIMAPTIAKFMSCRSHETSVRLDPRLRFAFIIDSYYYGIHDIAYAPDATDDDVDAAFNAATAAELINNYGVGGCRIIENCRFILVNNTYFSPKSFTPFTVPNGTPLFVSPLFTEHHEHKVIVLQKMESISISPISIIFNKEKQAFTTAQVFMLWKSEFPDTTWRTLAELLNTERFATVSNIASHISGAKSGSYDFHLCGNPGKIAYWKDVATPIAIPNHPNCFFLIDGKTIVTAAKTSMGNPNAYAAAYVIAPNRPFLNRQAGHAPLPAKTLLALLNAVDPDGRIYGSSDFPFFLRESWISPDFPVFIDGQWQDIAGCGDVVADFKTDCFDCAVRVFVDTSKKTSEH